jgi:hypothetical protein
MAYEEALTSITLPASADLSSYQYHLVSATTAAQAQLQTTKGGYVVGVIQDKSTAAGIGSKVGVYGVTKVAAGGAATTGFNVGTPLVCTTSGIATVWSTAGSYVWGIALEHLTSGTSAVVSALIVHAGYRTS